MLAAGGPVGKSVSLLNKQSALILVLAMLAAAVLIGHQTVPPMDRDESRFAQASKQMLASGDYVTVRFQDELRAKKPAGIYWLQSAAAGLFGADDIAAYRLPSLLAFLVAIWGTYHLASHLYRKPRALLAAAVLGASLLAFAEAHLAKTDTVLMALCLAQQMALMRIYLAVQLGRHTAGAKLALVLGLHGRGHHDQGADCPASWSCDDCRAVPVGSLLPLA
jgi:4-amino-4-deoxy-L-arabinose transferase-like glycosyltransferase